MAKDARPIAFIPEGLLMPSAMRLPPTPEQISPNPDVAVHLEADQEDGVKIDPATGAIEIEDGDGGVIINFNPRAREREGRPNKFNDNLAELMSESELANVANKLLMDIQFDEQSRREWLDTRAQGIRIMALKIEQPRSSIDSTASLDQLREIEPLIPKDWFPAAVGDAATCAQRW